MPRRWLTREHRFLLELTVRHLWDAVIDLYGKL